MEDSQKLNLSLDTDEILVKGEDNKWYILKGDELLPYKPEGIIPAQVVKTAPAIVLPAPSSAPAAKTTPPMPRPAFKDLHEGHPLVKELDELVEETVKEVNLSFSDQILAKRFRSLVSARLRGVKDALETKDALMRDLKIGGLGLRSPEAEKILAVLEKKYKRFEEKWRAVEEKKIAEWKKKKTEEGAKREMEEKRKEREEIERRHYMLLGKAGIVGKVKKVEEVRKEEKKISNSIRQPADQISKVVVSPPMAKIQKPPVPPSVVSAPPSVVAPRPKMVDVKFTPRLLSSLEELKEMTLIDFRRLARDPQEAILKIKAKIELLERESFAQKMEGLAAWKQSEPIRLFRELSSEAVQTGRSVTPIIIEREKNQKKTLTEAEFYAIMDLNRSLRF